MKFAKKTTNNPVELANTECGIECGTRPIVGLSVLYSCSNFAHNGVSFSEKLRNFPENLFGQNGIVGSVDVWNRTEILIDSHIIRG